VELKLHKMVNMIKYFSRAIAANNRRVKMKTILFFSALVWLLKMNSYSRSVAQYTEEKTVKTNGINTYCKIIGEGEPVIVIHGGPGMAHNYLLPKFSKLVDNHKVIFYDQRACGKTNGEEFPEEISLDNMVKDLEALRLSLGIEKMNLIGQSWGGLIAMNYAVKYPEKLKSLILLESAPASSLYEIVFTNNIMELRSEDERKELEEISKAEEYKNGNPKAVVDYYHSYFKPYFYDRSFLKELDLSYFDYELIRKSNIADPILMEYMTNFDIYNELNVITVPTLIIHGKQDVIPYWSIERIHKSIPSSEFILLDECGHFAYLEKNKEYFDYIEKFLRAL
jgi:proline iminopeptidase